MATRLAPSARLPAKGIRQHRPGRSKRRRHRGARGDDVERLAGRHDARLRRLPPSAALRRVRVRHLQRADRRELEAPADDGWSEQPPCLGDDSIVFAYRPAGTGCFKPRVWQMRSEGGQRAPVMRTLPDGSPPRPLRRQAVRLGRVVAAPPGDDPDGMGSRARARECAHGSSASCRTSILARGATRRCTSTTRPATALRRRSSLRRGGPVHDPHLLGRRRPGARADHRKRQVPALEPLRLLSEGAGTIDPPLKGMTQTDVSGPGQPRGAWAFLHY